MQEDGYILLERFDIDLNGIFLNIQLTCDGSVMMPCLEPR